MIVGITTEGGDQEDFKRMGYCVDFLDNGFVQGEINIEKFIQKIYVKQPTYAILPDNDTQLAIECLQRTQGKRMDWIYPLHYKEQRFSFIDELKNVWIGFPHRKQWRDYSLTWFLHQNFEKTWYLGYWDSMPIFYLKQFNGMDTTMPIKLAVKTHRYWKRPKQHPKAPWGKNRHQLVNENMQTFMNYLKKNDLIASGKPHYPKSGGE